MLESLFDLLLCPYCGLGPPVPELQLFKLKSSEIKHGIRIHFGVIYCEGCSRFWMINDEILYMPPDNIRDKKKELDFLKQWENKLPSYIVRKAKPYNLQTN